MEELGTQLGLSGESQHFKPLYYSAACVIS